MKDVVLVMALLVLMGWGIYLNWSLSRVSRRLEKILIDAQWGRWSYMEQLKALKC